MKIVKFENVQDEFVRLTPRNMTLDDAMKKIAENIAYAAENDGKGKGRTGKIASFNGTKGKVFVRVKYGPTEAYCLEDAARTAEEAKTKILAYARALTTGTIAPSEKEAIRKVFISRREKMEKARSERNAKKTAA